MKTPTDTLLLILITAIAVAPPVLHLTVGVAQAADNATAQTKNDDNDLEQARERQDQDRERLQEKQDRDQERQARQLERADRLYEKGTNALDKRQWEDAASLFGELVQKGGDRAEGAYYWKAYAEYKQGQKDKALTTLAALKKTFPQSRWLDDAQQLEIEIRQARGQAVNAEGQTNEELKLMALNGLMHADPGKAVPLIKKLLQSSQPLKVKERALFVLSQSRSDEAREVIANFARGKANPDLQLKSLQYLALFGGKDSRQTLEKIYSSAADRKIKHAILGFFMIGGDRDHLLAVARGEKDADLREEAIGQLGVMGARDELFALYPSDSDVKAKKKILDALFIGGAVQQLIDLTQKEKNPELRRTAVEKLGLIKSPQTADALVRLYTAEKDKGVRKAIIQALFLQGDAKALVEVARKETDPELKKKAVEQLSVMGSKEGTEYFEELLKK